MRNRNYWPLAVLYDGVTRVRNLLYDRGWSKTHEPPRPVVSVGNLTVGGTGKTPLTEYLIERLSRVYELGVLSRGYQRETRGYRLASDQDNALTLGDEVYQMYRKYGHKVSIAVGEKRPEAAQHLTLDRPGVELIVLDDAYQHRRIGRTVNLLLTTFERPFFKDKVMPQGWLREARKGARRADAVVVTKCPADISEETMAEYKLALQKYTEPDTPIFFCSIRYNVPKAASAKMSWVDENKVVLFSGLAEPTTMEDYVRTSYQLEDSVRFPDHYRYRPRDVEKLIERTRDLGANGVLLTSEKDIVKWEAKSLKMLWDGVPLFFLPMEIYFLAHGPEFDQWLFESLAQASR
ncbi:MAG TPA: tetraacyldisaccharide 4'-kinase [Cytophagales bacterium]|nr:tetraacyldisaccharide 4'-kinase [Cytophagales bacterium]HAA19521.1 tetraacyldisaccharide 4'-kinase [Cytophagales bacterium]HAP59606.1 tetraacyldisaccharide 4'-kinase [Cytophagales bacterium]